jgi:diguanylate cyclase (GGDEF)-like protein
MSRALRVVCCRNYRPEMEAAVAAEAWTDVTVSAVEPRCGRPPLSWADLRPLVPGDDTDVLVLGGACLCALEVPPGRRETARLCRRAQCFELVAGAAQIADALDRDAYLVTPGWLASWRQHLAALGFEGTQAAALFREFARELVLLDTGVSAEAAAQVTELGRALALPASRAPVGLDPARQLLGRLVAEWRLDVERREAATREAAHGRERADLVATLDFVGRLALLSSEDEAVPAIEELFRMLFAPRRLQVVHLVEGAPDASAPPDLRAEIEGLTGDWAPTASGTGFLLRVAFAGEPVAVVVLDGLAFPQYRERYLELARAAARVSALAIRNARACRRLTAAEDNLLRSERTLRLAQAIAHVGHWEVDDRTGAFTWSEEAFQIFGLAPGAVAPSREAFLRVVHPDDRAAVEQEIRRARMEGRFDLEYRIVLPGGGERVVHSLGEALYLGPDRQLRMVGTVTDVSDLGRGELVELLGVVQDVTERRALERRLDEEARTDALTGCANRRAFLREAEQEFARVRRYGGDLSLMMLDVDHFKTINDRRGHPAGDEALRELARVCAGTLRAQDVVGRVGGEEFAVLLRSTGEREATEVAERLRQAVAATEVRVGGGPPLRLTTSVGVAGLHEADPAVETVLARADRALHEAKAAGRDRVVALAPADRIREARS